MFKSGFEYPSNYLRCYEELIGRKVRKDERALLISEFMACQKAFANAQRRKKIE